MSGECQDYPDSQKTLVDDTMRRADRLFRIVEYLKARRDAVTADELAAAMETGVRTIYRDVVDLRASGVPLIGEAGVGYLLNRDYLVKPLMFDVEELESLTLGAQMVESWGDPAIARSARQAIDKIIAVLPDSLADEARRSSAFSHPSSGKKPLRIDFSSLRRAIRAKRLVDIRYVDVSGEESERRIRPLCLTFIAPVWLVAAWCESRDDFRHFRIDRIRSMKICGDQFRDEKGKTLSDLQEQLRQQQGCESNHACK